MRSQLGIPALCLGAVWITACSVDVSKLRAPVAKAMDASTFDTLAAEAATPLVSDADSTVDLAFDAPIESHPSAEAGAEPILDSASADQPDPGAGEAGGIVGIDAETTSDAGDERSIDVPQTHDAPTAVIDATPVDLIRGPDAAAIDAAADGLGEEAPVPALDPDLVLWYPFDESTGAIAHDSAQFDGVARNATLASAGAGASATFSTTRQVGSHALALSPSASSGGYLVIPTLDTIAPDAVTIALWVNLSAATMNQNWERLFDYADSSTSSRWFNLTARQGASPYGPLWAMSNIGHAAGDQQKLAGSTALTPGVWHHIAVVLPPGATFTGVMYVDGAVAATSEMTLHLADIGATANNWIGRSQYANDPYFAGLIDDFRVYKRALSKAEIAALIAVR